MNKAQPLFILKNSKPLDDLIKIEDELRDDYDNFKFIYLDANKQRGQVDLAKFSYNLAKFDFDLDCFQSIIDLLRAKGGD